jgi:tryptophan synthase alpha chain
MERFYTEAIAAGADALLIADLPLREAAPFQAAARRHGLGMSFILPPDADRNTLNAVASRSDGYVYVLGRRGVTGAERAAQMPLPETLAHLRRAGAPPPVIGFGVSTPDQVRAALDAGAAGAIVGSALVNTFAEGGDGAGLVARLKQATLPSAARVSTAR